MIDVTELFDHYRFTVRNVWNECFWSQPELRDWVSVNHFEQLKRHLFVALVIERLSDAGSSLPSSYDHQTIPFFVRSKAEVGPGALIGYDNGSGSVVWKDDILPQLNRDEWAFRFIEYFDFDRLNWADFRYYKTRIVQSASHPKLVGHEALIQAADANVFVDEDVARRLGLTRIDT